MSRPSLAAVDVGAPLLRGAARQAGTEVDITAAGEDIWHTRDEFHFAHSRVSGDFVLIACIESFSMADLYTKAGLMLRASLDAGAEHVYLLAFGDNQPRNRSNGGIEFQFRPKADGHSIAVYPPQPLPERPDFPARFPGTWLRLSRIGDTFTAATGPDGEKWKTFAIHSQRLPATAYAGLAVTSHNVNQTVRVVFRHVDLR